MSSRTRMIALVVALMAGPLLSAASADYVFGTPTVITTNIATAPSVTADGLTLCVDAPNEANVWEIWFFTRETTDDEWGIPFKPTPPDSDYQDGNPEISPDGLTLYFNSTRPGGSGDRDLWQTTRITKEDPWSEPANLGTTINGPYQDAHPSISGDGLMLFFASDRPGGYGNRDIYVSTRPTINDPWSEPENLGALVNSSLRESGPDISSDGLTLLFDSARPDGYGLDDVYATTRPTLNDAWSVPVNLGPTINDYNSNYTANFSTDGSVLYWWSSVGRLREVPIIPLVDFGGDGNVDGKELLAMIAEFGSADTGCDIAPMPFGNGLVDFEDFKMLAEYIGTDIDDPTLIAHWTLDETEGSTAYDATGTYDGDVFGDPLWQPQAGMVDGAIELDGIDDYVSTPSVLNPGQTPAFSVFAWVKGGLPGQSIVSQADGVDWLAASPSDGYLMTGEAAGRGAQALLSDVDITDGDWHRVGFTWDDVARTLYVDDAIATWDIPPGLLTATEGLRIGAGPIPEPATLWWGLIDDVRIYNRAVTP